MAVTIIGAGKLGGAIAGLAAKAGASVQVIARDPEKAAVVATPLGATEARLGDTITGDIVVLAVPYRAVSGVLDTYRSAFDSKTVVDVTNPIDFETVDGLVVPSDSSGARVIQDALPAAHVVKAFNTNFSSTLASGTTGALPTTVLVAGDDAASKRSVIDLVVAAGLRGVDAGALRRARELEALALLQISLAVAGRTPWTGGFTLVG